MKEITLKDSIEFTMPDKFCLVLSKDNDEQYNVAGFSWFTLLSTSPGKVMLATSKRGYTGECIKQTKKIALCFPSEDIKKESMQCCTCSGRDTDKIEKFGLGLIDVEGQQLPIINGSVAAWFLKLHSCSEADDHNVFIFDFDAAVEISEKPQLITTNGYKTLTTYRKDK